MWSAPLKIYIGIPLIVVAILGGFFSLATYTEIKMELAIALGIIAILFILGPIGTIMYKRKRMKGQNRIEFHNDNIRITKIVDGSLIKDTTLSSSHSIILDLMHGAIFIAKDEKEADAIKGAAIGDHAVAGSYFAGYSIGGLEAAWTAREASRYIKSMNMYYEMEKHMFACQVSNWKHAKKFLDENFTMHDEVKLRYREYTISSATSQAN